MKFILMVLLAAYFMGGCAAPTPSPWTDERIILGCRFQQVTVAELDKRFGDSSEWLELKGKIQPNDELWQFCTPAASWEEMMGFAGYALFRQNKLIGKIITELN